MLLSAWAATTLYSFAVANDGNGPTDPVVDAQGNLYGTTSSGGAYNRGTVFEIAHGTNAFTTLYSFTGGSDGAAPQGNLVVDPQGNLFGSNGAGAVFEIANASHAFSIIGGTEGTSTGCLVLDAQGDFYGTNRGVGTDGNGD